ncbi:uncharacterized protein BP01DRAFT_17767 [Aspergillus saccharolyticus JOP 1030-1]|uniref:Uncharacterized protein n=1 Tax=Aspergillus saccharolyticus JOP 1030-1 TaxID=1450539 RepID=A0A318ZRL0_9EURO|nr:hypothetical protein BP01DRAFT_17767 [Aspergillus saccharolyticus JOP 1030-1]PYH46590.1 hypothetical protein BP01DRAFT_17767 [Aspergillus saccharolyticus JOP 1030-1]
MSSLDKILEAVSTLSNIQEAQRDDLLLYRDKLTVALHTLHSLLQTPCSSSSIIESFTQHQITANSFVRQVAPSPAAQSSATPAPATIAPATTTPAVLSPASTAPSPATCALSDDPAPIKVPDDVLQLMKRLEKHKDAILQCMQGKPESVVWSRTDWSTEDPRIVDISQSDTEGKFSPEINIRCGMSAISLADDYTDWEMEQKLPPNGKSRIDQLSENTGGNRKSHYKEFVDNSDFNDRLKARKYVGYGIQLHVFSKIYRRCLGVDTPSLGIIGIISSCFWAFVRVRFCNMPLLARLIASSEWKGYACNNNEWTISCYQSYKRLNT